MKNKLIKLLQNLLKVFFIFPVRKKRVLFSAYSGKNYSCNPKYISKALYKKAGDQLEIVWAFQKPEHYVYLKDHYTLIRFKSLKYLYYALTARVVVDNVESWSILPKRKGQLVINTWHGGGAYKGVGLQRRDTDKDTDQNMLQKHKRVDIYLSSSKAFTEMTLRNSFGFKKSVMECGMPRNDILVRQDTTKAAQVRSRIKAPENVRLVLYAPTFRADKDYHFELDAERTLNALKERFGGTWRMLYRAHYYLGSDLFTKENIQDVSTYDDMQELLLISDVLITDYSSSIWDFSLTKRPAFLFTPDVDRYQNERAFYTPIEEWPYPYSQTMDGFVELIRKYDPKTAIEKIEKHHKALGNKESGEATERVVNTILSAVGKSK